MGRRKIPKTLDEMRDEVARLEKEKMQTENRLKQRINALQREERNARTRRLIHEGAFLESLVPELKLMSRTDKEVFIKAAVTGPEAARYLQQWRAENGENEIGPDTG